ncbi:lysozyme inhibitor LprI family protein [Aquabacter spiritensis]|uniref:Lysozyme inhibitor LprI N-terminal domain-containing protein n=1 Tax=Aquabacter spiritensis TaxID=933073 RepID=A0A4R3M580_9HYPH|nr:hypothetical protein [Aquabacter spiritensis]TCT08036.1 hypothetical protein EDC64_101555 [Aquabacter spiritensis]
MSGAGGLRSAGTRRALVHGTRVRFALVLLSAAILATLSPRGFDSPVRAASFDCAAAHAPDEAAVCGDRTLDDLDVEMATLYGVVTRLVGMGRRGDLQDEQRAFLRARAACGAAAPCLTAAYRARIAALRAVLDDIAARGPY